MSQIGVMDDLAQVVRTLREHHREHVDLRTGRDVDAECPWCRLWHAWCDEDIAAIDALEAQWDGEQLAGTTIRLATFHNLATATPTLLGRVLTLREALHDFGAVLWASLTRLGPSSRAMFPTSIRPR